VPFESFNQVLTQLGPLIISESGQRNISQVMDSTCLRPISSYLECRLDDQGQVDLTNCYAFKPGIEASIPEQKEISQIMATVDLLPLNCKPKWFWLEYDDCQQGLSVPGVHLSLNQFEADSEPKSLNRDDSVTVAIRYIEALFATQNLKLVDKFQQIMNTIVAHGAALHLSKLCRYDCETIKVHTAIRVDDVTQLLETLNWQGPINKVCHILGELQQQQCVEQIVFLDLSVTQDSLLPCLGIYIADKAMSNTNKTPFYHATQQYLMQRVNAPQKVTPLFNVINNPAKSNIVWCDFKIFVDDDKLTYKAYLGIQHDLTAVLNEFSAGLANLFG
jgi:hypothetical protein